MLMWRQNMHISACLRESVEELDNLHSEQPVFELHSRDLIEYLNRRCRLAIKAPLGNHSAHDTARFDEKVAILGVK